MCGICGELRFDGRSPDLGAIDRMSETLARRGPDHAGTFADGPLAFGHRRLAIIDLSASADQPMVDPALQLALVFNGTIYNYRELRAELVTLGYTFFSEGDSEVILKAITLGRAMRATVLRHVRVCDLGHTRGAPRQPVSRARPLRHQAALSGAGWRSGCASRRACPR